MIDAFGAFLNRAAQIPLLTHEQEIALGRQIRSWKDSPNPDDLTIRKGQRAKQQIVQANIRLVVDIAKRHQNRGVEIPDLVQEGCLGLNRAAELFDPTKGYRFSTYAYAWITQAIVRGIEYNGRAVRLPNHVHELLTSARKEIALFSERHGKNPTLRQLAERLVDNGRLHLPAYYPKRADPMDLAAKKLSHAFQISRDLYSLNAKLPNMDEELEVIDALYCHGPRPEEAVAYSDQRELVRRGLGILTPEEREIIIAYFGLDGWPPRSMTEIARARGGDFTRARARVRRLQARAMRHLRRWVEVDATAVELVKEA